MSKSFNNSHTSGNIPLGTAENFSIVCSAAANNLTITINDREGNAPSNTSAIIANFRSTTLTTGTSTYRTANSALTFTINDTNTMGVTTNQPFRLHLYLFDNSGTLVLSAFNATNHVTNFFVYKPDIGQLQTSASGTNGGSLAHTFYASVSAITSKAIVYLGFLECDSTSFTAGKWGSSGTGLITRVVKWYPGMPMPGDVVQTKSSTANAISASTTSTTFVSTGDGLTITPTCVPNLIRARASGTGLGNANDGGGVRFSRGTTNNTNLFGSMNLFSQDSAFYLGWTILGMDAPFTTSSQTYVIQGRSVSGASFSIFGDVSFFRFFELQEIST